MKRSDQDGVIDLRGEDGVEFRIGKVSDEAGIAVEEVAARSTDMVKVKFEKFVSLVANHDYEDMLERHTGEEIYMKADLLTELADIPVEKPEKKFPTIFVFGLIVGGVIAWLLFKG